ncbi:hypothetical protein Tco_0060174 [Tanacetum coccineum]
MSFSKRQGNDVVCYTKPLDSLKSWNDRFFWVDVFACPASFPWNTSKIVSKDPFPKSSQYNAEHYATLFAYPAPFHKVEMDLLFFIRTADPTKVRVSERQRAEGEPKLLDTTMGGGQTEQGDSASGGHGVGIPQVSETAEIVAEDAAPVEYHEASTGPSVAGKSMSTLQRLLVGAVLNSEVRIAALPTLPFITSYVSVTPERESEDQTDSMAGANLRTITAPPRFVISSDSSHHLGANIAEAEVDSFVRPSILLMTVATTVTSTVDPATTVKEKFVESFIFGGDSSGGGADHSVGGFSDLIGSECSERAKCRFGTREH